MADTTKKPQWASITREENKLQLQWKITDDNYGRGQQLQYRVNRIGEWTALACGKNTTNKEFTVPVSLYYPNTDNDLLSISFRVRGHRNTYTKKKNKKNVTVDPAWSAWAEQTYNFAIPKNPKTTFELKDGTTNTSTFSWVHENETNTERYTTRLFWESILIKDCATDDGAEAFAMEPVSGSYQSGFTTTWEDSMDITESASVLATGSFTRWVRMWSDGLYLGPGQSVQKVGSDSRWVIPERQRIQYERHTYAKPVQTVVTDTTSEETDSGYDVVVGFDSESTPTNPIDSGGIQPQYLVVIPAAGLSVPAGSQSWTDATGQDYSIGSETARFSVDGVLDNDYVLFARVNTLHDTASNTTYGKPILLSVGRLKAPTITNISQNQSTYRATITATNNSDVPDSFLLVSYVEQTANGVTSKVLGVIPQGETSVQIQCPNWTGKTIGFSVQAVVGQVKTNTDTNNNTIYTYYPFDGKPEMTSAVVYQGGTVPAAPTGVTATATDTEGMIRVRWNWSWSEATAAEISWSQNRNAWQSTDEPETFFVSSINKADWYITDLESGVDWYVRVRLLKETTDSTLYGPWSDITAASTVSLKKRPQIPTLMLSDTVITQGGEVTCYWGYSSGDGTPQAYAEICLATVGASITYGNIIAHTTTAQHVTIPQSAIGAVGGTYYLCVRVTSGSGKQSDGWSAPKAIKIASPITCNLTSSSLSNITVSADDDNETTRTVTALLDLPMSVSVTGAGTTGISSVVIQRAADCFIERPDGRTNTGHKGEVIAQKSRYGAGPISITIDDLVGSLDDGGVYVITATVQDGYGQTASKALHFEVHWSHQAILPQATVVVDAEDFITKITPVAPTGADQTDRCDIYRLSTDKPELIFPDAEFGTTYVDPYPAFGIFGGHRLVFKTKNGDFTTEDNEIAWLDLGENEDDYLESGDNIIDFNGNRVFVKYNIDLSNKWEKDFKETKYLGGSVQGDWNAAVSRSGSIGAAAVVTDDPDTIQGLRELAVYAGICHVRTADGSSYAANVNVSENRNQDSAHKICEFTLDIKRVDPEGYDGLTYEQWSYEEEDEEE